MQDPGVPARRSARYLDAFNEIWRLQSYLLSEADRAGIPIVSNTDVDDVFREVMRIILERLSTDFSGEPEDVAKTVLRALDRGAAVVYAPPIWRLVMAVIRSLPRAVMRRIAF